MEVVIRATPLAKWARSHDSRFALSLKTKTPRRTSGRGVLSASCVGEVIGRPDTIAAPDLEPQ